MTRFVAAIAAVFFIVLQASAAERAIDTLLPERIAPGFSMDGKVATYAPENLYKYIDGEAELYLPYGFEKAATARYAQSDGAYGIVASIFKMGSLLDAFGIYASYRGPEARLTGVGAEGFSDGSQLMFYQDRYFVRLEVSGAASGKADVFNAAAQRISRNLPAGRQRPGELEFLKVAGAFPLTDRYYASGLLGYSFFGRGLTSEVAIGRERAKIFVALFPSGEAACRGLDEYGNYLKAPGVSSAMAGAKKGVLLHAVDPLYKGIVLALSGRYIVGVAGLKDGREGDGTARMLIGRLPGE
ncbi:MAG: DUF6599 family protein [Syntrophorhabdales bacterium]|jgi:hypothetical protein